MRRPDGDGSGSSTHERPAIEHEHVCSPLFEASLPHSWKCPVILDRHLLTTKPALYCVWPSNVELVLEPTEMKSYVLMNAINTIYRMELYQIRHFAAVAETGSFTRAAKRAAVSQPALSASIAKLEEELRVKLFHRSAKSVTLTPAGRRFHMTAQEVLGACNKVKAELRASVADRPLRIGVLLTLPSAQLARLIETLQGELPETRIELVDGTREQLHTQLAGRKLLASISTKEGSEPGQRSVELLRENYGLVVSLGVALMPAIFDAPNVKKVPVRDFDATRVIALHWNEDVKDDRLDRLVPFATAHNWARSDPEDFEALDRLSRGVAIAELGRLGIPI